jgi:hypothetical protein
MSKGVGKECGWFFKKGEEWLRYDKNNESIIESYYKKRVEIPFKITIENCDYLISFQDWKQTKVGDGSGIGLEIKKEDLNRISRSSGAILAPSAPQMAEIQSHNTVMQCIIFLIVVVILHTYANKYID